MKTWFLIFNLIVSGVFFATTESAAQAANKSAPEKRCSEKTIDHFNDRNSKGGNGLEKIAEHKGQVDRAEKAAADCRDKNREARERGGGAGNGRKN